MPACLKYCLALRYLDLKLGQAFEVAVRKGDVVVLATDGLIDNVFPEETAALINTLQKRGDPPRVAAAGLADFARFRYGSCDSISESSCFCWL